MGNSVRTADADGASMATMTITWFLDVFGKEREEWTGTWVEFIDILRGIPPQTKKIGRLVKLATFGSQATGKGCLRHDQNVIHVTGIEGDYDAGLVQPEEAVKRLEKHDIQAVVATTHSHEPGAPRWRVFAPLSKAGSPGARRAHVARLNGALGGILGKESFGLSQSYFVGGPVGGEYKVLPTFNEPERGTPIDLLQHLDGIATPGEDDSLSGGTEPLGSDSNQDWLGALLAGEDVHDNALKLVGRWVNQHWQDAQIRGEMALLAAEVEKARGPERAKCLMGAELDRMIQGAREKGFRTPTLTDTGNASRLVELHGERLHYIAKWNTWLVCGEDGHWSLDHGDVGVRELAKDVGHQLKVQAGEQTDAAVGRRMLTWAHRSLGAPGISGMTNLARGIQGIPLDHEELDADGELLGVENGVVDLRTGEHRPANPGDLITIRCPVAWDKDAVAPRWEKAMTEWFRDPEVRAYVQRIAGSALFGGQKDHNLIIHYGGGRNGKGTFVRALQHVLGGYAAVIHLSLLVETKTNQHDTVKADLFRKRLAVASETQKRVKLDEASVKNLTGGDRISARRMREDPWEFSPTHNLWLQTNHLPEVSGRDVGIWSRIRVVPWKTTFNEDERDTNLDETLAKEAPGILSWLVKGCLEWREKGLQEPRAVVAETASYRKAEDKFARFVEATELEFSPTLEIAAGELRQMLDDWGKSEGIKPPMRELNGWLEENGAFQRTERRPDPIMGERRPVRMWKGVGIAGTQDGESSPIATTSVANATAIA